MHNNTRWIARWVDGVGRQRTCVFDGPDNMVVARLDFQLKLIDWHERIPNEFELEKVFHPDEGETTLLPAVRRSG
jgi:hypothetical protein